MINIFTRVAVLSTVGSLSLLGGACTSPSATPPPCEGGACLDADTSSAADSDVSSSDQSEPETEACPATSPWSGDSPAFSERAPASLGLKGVLGTVLTVVDVDQDGWPDLLVRRGGADDFSTGERSNWLLRNDQKGGFEDITEKSGLFTPRLKTPAGKG